MKQHFFLFATSILMLSACSKEVITQETVLNQVVVEAYLYPDIPVTINLSKMFPFTEEGITDDLAIDTAEIHITYNGTDYLMTSDPSNPGQYYCDNALLIVEEGETYELSFLYNNYEVKSETTIPTSPNSVTLSTTELDVVEVSAGEVQDPLTVIWTNPKNEYHQIKVEYLESDYSAISERLVVEDYPKFKTVATEPILGERYDLNIRAHLVFYGTYRVIVYKVNKEYVNLYENLSQSTLNLTAPLTNIENGLGIFTGLNADTTYVEVSN
ncbi:MAG: hypothetical protein ACI8ZM_004298 [Crocinitomix sp.]|jgi:hypothetical protein